MTKRMTAYTEVDNCDCGGCSGVMIDVYDANDSLLEWYRSFEFWNEGTKTDYMKRLRSDAGLDNNVALDLDNSNLVRK